MYCCSLQGDAVSSPWFIMQFTSHKVCVRRYRTVQTRFYLRRDLYIMFLTSGIITSECKSCTRVWFSHALYKKKKMDLFFVAGSAAVTGVFTYLWLKKSKNLAAIEDAPLIDINSDLYKIVSETPDKSIPYAVIQGYISATNRPIISQYVANIYGVIQTLICREHKREWSTSTRLWYDKTRSITDHTKTVPFAITSDFASVHVEDPLQASCLELELIYDKFEPTESSISENILSWASWEKTKGFERIELMLPEGVCLTGVGEICLKDNRVLIKPPSAGQEYILTTSSPAAVIQEFQSKIRRWKLLAIIFSSVTITFIFWGLRKWYKRHQEAVAYDEYLQRVVDSRASEGTDVDDGTTEHRKMEPCVNLCSEEKLEQHPLERMDEVLDLHVETKLKSEGGRVEGHEVCAKPRVSSEMGDKANTTEDEGSIVKQEEKTCQLPVSTLTASVGDLPESLSRSDANKLEHSNDPIQNLRDQKIENETCVNHERKRKTLSQPTLNFKKLKRKEDAPDETSKLSILMKPSRVLKGENFHCDYFSHFMPRLEADKLFSDCEETLAYFEGELATVKLYGRSIPIPRKQVAYGDDGLTYTYSGNTVPARPWLPFLADVRQKIEDVTSFKFNFVLINRYKDGQDSIGEHRDDEKDLDLNHPIASLSLGQHRDFVFRHKDTRGRYRTRDIDPIKLELAHGSLLMMNPPTNDFWYHSLPKRANQNGVRINMTFRKILRQPEIK